MAQGFYEAIGIEDVAETLRIVDKLDKVGGSAVTEMLAEGGRLRGAGSPALALAEIFGTDARVAEEILALGHTSTMLEEGLGKSSSASLKERMNCCRAPSSQILRLLAAWTTTRGPSSNPP